MEEITATAPVSPVEAPAPVMTPLRIMDQLLRRAYETASTRPQIDDSQRAEAQRNLYLARTDLRYKLAKDKKSHEQAVQRPLDHRPLSDWVLPGVSRISGDITLATRNDRTDWVAMDAVRGALGIEPDLTGEAFWKKVIAKKNDSQGDNQWPTYTSSHLPGVEICFFRTNVAGKQVVRMGSMLTDRRPEAFTAQLADQLEPIDLGDTPTNTEYLKWY